MDKFERVVLLHRILDQARYPVKKETLYDELDCSRATLYRTVAFLRDNLSAPIEQNESGDFYYDRSLSGRYDLPGLWLSAEELTALLMAYKVLESRQPGALSSAFTALRERIEQLMAHDHMGKGQLLTKIHIMNTPSRPVNERHFATLANALVEQKQLKLNYHGRIKDQISRRVISPLGMSFYRENWYLDAWCHLRDGLRRFSVDRIESVEMQEEKVDSKLLNKPLKELKESAYGVFSGTASQKAVIVFSEQAARWVADEQWHRDQEGKFLDDGSYQLSIPIDDATEIMMDVLRYGERAEIISPPELRKTMAERTQKMAGLYQN
ncbi:MAG: helix-turn-helix transcriptional regulator [bacterium]